MWKLGHIFKLVGPKGMEKIKKDESTDYTSICTLSQIVGCFGFSRFMDFIMNLDIAYI